MNEPAMRRDRRSRPYLSVPSRNVLVKIKVDERPFDELDGSEISSCARKPDFPSGMSFCASGSTNTESPLIIIVDTAISENGSGAPPFVHVFKIPNSSVFVFFYSDRLN